MRFSLSLRSFSLGCALALLGAGAAWAQPADSPVNAADSSADWLAGGTARLGGAIDSRSAKQGDAVEAKLDSAVKTPDGTELPAGTKLQGSVSAVQASQGRGPSSVSIRFTKAELKSGKVVPVKVVVTAAYPNNDGQTAFYGDSLIGPAERRVSIKDQFDQEPGTLSHIAMNSAAGSSDSATFSNNKGDVKLQSGTFLQIGIAQQTSGLSTAM